MLIKFPKHYFIAAWLLASLTLCLQSCDDQGTQPAKQKVQFTFSTGSASDNGGRIKETELPQNTRLRVSIETSSGTPVLSDHEIEILKAGDSYIADPVELMPGAYVITDFVIVSDSELLYAAPKAGSPLSAFVTHALPYNFTVTGNSIANVNMQVIDGREHAPEEFGYASFKANVVNVLSVTVFKEQNGQTSLTAATAELRQNKELIKTFSLNASVNKIGFEGEVDAEYTLVVYTKEEAKVLTFNFKELKEGLGTSPLKITLEPALILTMQSHTAEGEEWDDYFELALDGAGGAIAVNWGDGNQQTATLPYEGSHEYTYGTYTAIVTGDIDRITDFYGFAYETYMINIQGLTNLTALRDFNPSWGVIPIHLDFTGCVNLESVFIEKFGPPAVPFDLRTDFRLPPQHFIKDFVFYAPALEEVREKVTPEELEVLVANIYNNATQRQIHGGRFIVTPVSDPLPGTQQMLNVLENDYGWNVGLNSEDIYDYGSEAGRGKVSLDARRQKWLQSRFPDYKRAPRSPRLAFMN